MYKLKTHNTMSKFGALFVTALLALSQFVGNARQQSADKSDRIKSDYIFLEALRYEAADSVDAYYDLISRAFELNPDDKYIGYDYGLYEALLYYPDSMQLAEHGLGLMKRYVMSNPEDYTAGLRYANMLGQIDRNDEAIDVYRIMFAHAKDPRLTGSAYASALAYSTRPDSIRKSIEIIDSLARYDGSPKDYLSQKVNYYNMLGDTAAVIREVHQVLDASPRDITNVVVMGSVYSAYQMKDSALYYFNKAVEMDPTNGMARYSRAQFFLESGDSTLYTNDMIEALHYPDLDIDIKSQLLQRYVADFNDDSTRYDSTRALIDEMVRLYPHEESLRQLYGSFLFNHEDIAGAAEQFQYLVSLNPDDAELWRSLSWLYYLQEDNASALATIKKALRYFPKEIPLYEFASFVCMNDEKYNQSEDYLNKALELMADSDDTEVKARLISSKGDLYYKVGNLDSAFSFYKQAIELDPANSQILNNMAYYLACNDMDLDDALTYVENALLLELVEEKENKSTTIDTYAWVLFKRKEYEKALEEINRVLELSDSEDSADVYEHAGDIYFMNGKPAEALEFWTKALELDPDNELLQKKVKHKTFFYE
ncbi:MAG: tetratricopeptide repeat protein [Bacteroides sp.]|nr:tetratricopeptide repeat protein [Bacteroides sp.]MCM1414206.1 tetratricopeptide repeat protein [Bacteroides sp.]MCM1472028.1 tetratricopeptide repeat protein [Bacteroides sp.]